MQKGCFLLNLPKQITDVCVFLSFGLSLFDRFKVKLTPGTARRGKGSKSYTEFLQ